MRDNRRSWYPSLGFLGMVAAWWLMVGEPAWAADGSVNSVGAMLAQLMQDAYRPFGILLACGAYLVGFWLIALGLGRLRDSATAHSNQAFLDGMLRIMGGAFLVSLPDAVGAGLISLYKSNLGSVYNSSVGFANPAFCLSNTMGGPGNSSTGLTCVAKNIATNVVPIFIDVSFGIFYLVGVGMIVHAIYTVATSKSMGNHQPPKGWFARLVVGAVICNVPHLMYAAETTLGIAGGTIGLSGFQQGSSLLQYFPPAGSTVLQQYGQLIGYVFTILVMFGILAVWRGIVHLNHYAAGNTRGELGSGCTHIVAGVLLANAKWTTCIVTTTLFGTSYNFCG